MSDDLTAEERALILEQAGEKYEMYAGDEIRKALHLYDRQRVVLDVLRKSLADAPIYSPKQHREPTPQEIGEAFAVLEHLRRVVAMLDGEVKRCAT